MAKQLESESSDPAYDDTAKTSKKDEDDMDGDLKMDGTGVGGDEGGGGEDPGGAAPGG